MKEVIHEMFSKEQVEERIAQIAEQLNKDYEEKPLRVICILRGSVFFFAELVKQLKMPVTIDFMAASSYGNEVYSSGRLEIIKDLSDPVEGLDCLIVEDIVDSGNTISMVKKMIMARNPKSVKVCSLLDKPVRRETEVDADYVGFVIPDDFVVGFGLDYAQKYRNLPYIGRLEFIEE